MKVLAQEIYKLVYNFFKADDESVLISLPMIAGEMEVCCALLLSV